MPLRQYVIYDHPKDLPDYWVVRGWNIYDGVVQPDRAALLFNTAENARTWIQQECPGATLIASNDPDPHIYEVWM
jgi:hypothetical protein